MKKTISLFCCLFLCFIQAGADEACKITIEFNNQPLDSCLCQLERQSGCRFIYQNKVDNRLITEKFKNRPVSEILDVLFYKTDYSHVIGRWFVIIYREIEAKSFIITGKVVDEKGNKIMGASIYIKGEEKVYTNTDTDGNFAISTANTNAYLLVLYLGYLPQVVPAKDAGLIKMEPNWELLNEVITIR